VAAPSISASGIAKSSGSGGSNTPAFTLPASGVQSGIAVVFLSVKNNGFSFSSLPSGWSELARDANGNGNDTLVALSGPISAAQSGTLSFVMGSAAMWILSWHLIPNGQVLHYNVVTNASTALGSHNQCTVDDSGNTDVLDLFALGGRATNSTQTSTTPISSAPSGSTLVQQNNTAVSGTNNMIVAVAQQTEATGGVTNGNNWSTGGNWFTVSGVVTVVSASFPQAADLAGQGIHSAEHEIQESNGSFENGDTTGWGNGWFSNNAPLTADSTDKFDGTYSGRVTVDVLGAGGDTAAYWWGQRLAVTESGMQVVRAYMKATAGRTLAIWTRTEDGSGNLTGWTQSGLFTATGSWQLIWAYVDVPAGTAAVHAQTVCTNPTAVGEFWNIDRLSISLATVGLATVSQTSPPQSVSAIGVASSAASGTPSLQIGGVSVTATGIASGVLIGSPTASVGAVSVTATGIAGTAVLGTATATTGGVTLTAIGVASAAAIGTPSQFLALSVSAAGISSSAALGSPASRFSFVATGISSSAATGTPAATSGVVTLNATGISTGAATGTPAATVGAVSFTTVGVASSQASGTPSVAAGAISVTGVGIASGTAVGVPAYLLPALVLSPTGISGLAAVGSPNLNSALSASVVGFDSSAALGTPTFEVGGVSLSAVGIAGAAATGTPSYAVGGVTLAALGIASSANLGAPDASTGGILFTAMGISPDRALGTPTYTVGGVALQALGVSSEADVGQPSWSGVFSVSATGVSTGEVVGVPSFDTTLSVAAVGISTITAFGGYTVDQEFPILGIGTSEAQGTPNVLLGDLVLFPIPVVSAATVSLPDAFSAQELRTVSVVPTFNVGTPSGSLHDPRGGAVPVGMILVGNPGMQTASMDPALIQVTANAVIQLWSAQSVTASTSAEPGKMRFEQNTGGIGVYSG
jgi:hypothetical protein